MGRQAGRQTTNNQSMLIPTLVVLVTMYIITGILLLLLAFFMYRTEPSEALVNGAIIAIYIIAGFAGGTADAFTLFELFERKLEMHQGHLVKAAVELAKDWRTDRMLRKLEALLAVADETASLIITGNGDVVQPENDLIAIGSGGPYAQAAARALLENTELSAREIAEKALDIAGDICIYTNHFHTIEELSYKA